MRCAHMQGVSPDGLLQKIVRAKREMRKSMLSGYMQALDESEGLQDTIARLTARMGVGACAPPLVKHCPPRCGAHHRANPSLPRVSWISQKVRVYACLLWEVVRRRDV